MTGEEVFAKQDAEVKAQIEAHSDLQECLMNSEWTLGARVANPINELQGITTIVKPQDSDIETGTR